MGRSFGRLAGWTGLLVALLFLVFVGGTYPWMGSQVVRITTWGLIGMVGGAWLLLALVRPEWRPRRGTVLPVAVALAVATASAVSSPIQRVSLGSVAAGLLLALLFLALTRIAANPWFRPRVGDLLVVVYAVTVLGYLGQVAEAWWRWYAVLGATSAPPLRPDGAALTFGAPPIVAAVVVLIGPFAVARLATRRRPLAVAMALAGLVVVLVSASRAAYLGVILAGILAAWFAAADRTGHRPMLARLATIPRLPLVAAVAGLAIAALALGAQVGSRLGDLYTVLERFDIWASALALFRESPILGTGPGTWPILKFAANPPGVVNLVVPHAHSVVVQSLAELGLVGLGALGWLVGSLGRRTVAAASQTPSPDPTMRSAARATLAGIAGLAGMSIVDDFANLLAVVVPLVLLVAWVIAGLEGWTPAAASRTLRAGGDPGPGRQASRWAAVRGLAAPALALGGLAVVAAAGLRVADAGLAAEAGNRAADRGDWAAALDAYRRAAGTDPSMPLYQLELGTALAATGDRAGALAAYRAAARADGYAMNVLSTARLELAAGERSAALAGVNVALERGLGDPLVALNAGAIAEAGQRLDLATAAYGEALALRPELAASTWWQGRAVSTAAVVAVAHERLAARDTPAARVAAQLLRAYLGDSLGAEAELRGLPVDPARERAIAVVLELQGRQADALRLLGDALRRQPLEGNIAADLAALERRAGDDAAAARHEAWARMVGVGTAAQSAVSGSVVVPAEQAGWSGQPNNYPWMPYLRFAGRILTPPDHLVIVDR